MMKDRLSRAVAPETEGGDNMNEGELIFMVDVLKESDYSEVANEVIKHFKLPVAG